MPRLKTAVPKFRLHKPSGRALVTLHGKEHCLGPFGCPMSRKKYDKLVAEYLANARKPPVVEPKVDETTILELLVDYMVFAKSYYLKDGEPTSN